MAFNKIWCPGCGDWRVTAKDQTPEHCTICKEKDGKGVSIKIIEDVRGASPCLVCDRLVSWDDTVMFLPCGFACLGHSNEQYEHARKKLITDATT